MLCYVTIRECEKKNSCKRAKAAIKDLDIDDSQVGILELDEMDDGAAIQDLLEKKTSKSCLSVPFCLCLDRLIFVTGADVGLVAQTREPSRASGSSRSSSEVSSWLCL